MCSHQRGCQGGGAAGCCTQPGGEDRSELALGTGTRSPQQQPQPLALVCCEVPCPLPGHRWAGGGEKPRPLAAPWPHQARAAPGPLPQPTVLPPGTFSGSRAALPFVLPPFVCLLWVSSAPSHFWVETRLPSELPQGSIPPLPRGPTRRPARGPSRPDFAQFHLFPMNKDSTLYGLDEQGTLRMNWNITAKYSMSNPIFPSK